MLVVRIGGKQYRASEESIRRSGAGKYIVAYGGMNLKTEVDVAEAMLKDLIKSVEAFKSSTVVHGQMDAKNSLEAKQSVRELTQRFLEVKKKMDQLLADPKLKNNSELTAKLMKIVNQFNEDSKSLSGSDPPRKPPYGA